MFQISSDVSEKHHSFVLKPKGIFRFWKIKKCPSFAQFKQFLKILTKGEKIIFFILLSLFVTSSVSLLSILYFKNTEIKPAAGGRFVEGINTSVSGTPRFINPVYATYDIDRDLTELIYSGLMKYDQEGKIIPDLAESFQILNDGKAYEVYLKKKLFWSDGQPLTADDVVFTIGIIQNAEYKSPQIASWIGVKIEKISDLGIRFTLKNPYSSFLENLTQKIIPQHIWKNIDSQNFPLTIYNLKPVGSGPYKLKGYQQDNTGKIISLEVVRNQRYYGKAVYLSEISFIFFDSEQELAKAVQKKQIQGFSLLDPASFNQFKESDFQTLRFSLPRYFAVFFNPNKSEVLKDQNVRQALNLSTDKVQLIEKALLGYAQEVSSPLLPETYGLSLPASNYYFDLTAAKNLLQEAEFIENQQGLREKSLKKTPAFRFKNDLREGSTGKDVEVLQQCLAKDSDIYPEGKITGNFDSQTKKAVILFQEKYAKEILEPFGLTEGTGSVLKATRDKLNQICFPPPQETLPLKFSLTTVNQPFLVETANLLKEQWKTLGTEVDIKAFDATSSELKDIIKNRDYDAILFGEMLGAIPDPFPFWHSTQIKDPGLNLAIWQNDTADKLLEDIRQSNDDAERKQKLEQLQDILNKDAPAVFLYNPDYVYFISEEIKGVNYGFILEPSGRFADIQNWYIETSRQLFH